jgi:hypothetical protein
MTRMTLSGSRALDAPQMLRCRMVIHFTHKPRDRLLRYRHPVALYGWVEGA